MLTGLFRHHLRWPGDRANKVKLRAQLNTEEVEMGADELAMEARAAALHTWLMLPNGAAELIQYVRSVFVKPRYSEYSSLKVLWVL